MPANSADAAEALLEISALFVAVLSSPSHTKPAPASAAHLPLQPSPSLANGSHSAPDKEGPAGSVAAEKKQPPSIYSII